MKAKLLFLGLISILCIGSTSAQTTWISESYSDEFGDLTGEFYSYRKIYDFKNIIDNEHIKLYYFFLIKNEFGFPRLSMHDYNGKHIDFTNIYIVKYKDPYGVTHNTSRLYPSKFNAIGGLEYDLYLRGLDFNIKGTYSIILSSTNGSEKYIFKVTN